MDASPRDNRLLIWCLSGFQTAGLVLVLVALLYRADELGETLDDLNTAVGLGLYIALWATNWWATRKAVEGLDLIDPDRPVTGIALLGRGFLWGGVNGILFLLALLGPILVVIVADGNVTVLGMIALLAYVLVLGGIASFVFGSIIGLAFALIDWALLEIAHALWRAGSAGTADETPVLANASTANEDRPAG